MNPQLENAYSRAGILYGLIRHALKSGELSMSHYEDKLVYSWQVVAMQGKQRFGMEIELSTLGTMGVSLYALAEKIVNEWRGMFNDSRPST